MVSALVLVNTELTQQKQVLDQIKQVNGVEETHVLWGVYDLLVKITATSIDKLKEIIKHSLKQLTGVTMTLTLMIIE